jgi:hypothetical protein
MARKEKLGTLRGVGQWKKLETAGDVKRFLAWCIHSIRDQTLEPKTAAVLAQIGAFLLKTVETTDLENQLLLLQAQVEALQRKGEAQWGPNRKPT